MNGRILTCTSLSVGSIVTSEVTLTIVEGDSKLVEDSAYLCLAMVMQRFL